MSEQHTWYTKPTAGDHQQVVIDETNGKTIAVVYTDKDDAELIVRAVNSHAALVEALERIAEMARVAIESDGKEFLGESDVEGIALAALNVSRLG